MVKRNVPHVYTELRSMEKTPRGLTLHLKGQEPLELPLGALRIFEKLRLGDFLLVDPLVWRKRIGYLFAFRRRKGGVVLDRICGFHIGTGCALHYPVP